MENPSVGRIVHFVDAYSNHRAAIVVDVPEGGRVWQCVALAWYRIGNTVGWIHESLVPYDEDTKANLTWHWPERV